MGKYQQLLLTILRGASDANIGFEDLCNLLRRLGFEERVRGSHHLFRKKRDRRNAELVARRQQGQVISGAPSTGCASALQVGSRGLTTHYEIIIYWSGDDNAFVAEVPELPGCVAHGDSHESALANAQQAIELWIDTAHELGRDVPEPKGRRLMLA